MPASTSPKSVFQEICAREEAPVRDLARTLGLRLSTLEGKLRQLQQKGLIEFRDGRKRVALNAGSGYVVGIDLGGSHLHFALADFRGEIVRDSNIKIRPEDGPQKMIAQMKGGIRELAVQAGPAVHGRLRALAMSVPSPVDVEHGVVTWANNLPGWSKISLGHEMEKEFRVPVFLENDANMAATGEHWRGVARGLSDFVFVAIGTGIGSGVFANGKLVRGRTGSAGELFRMNLDWTRWGEDFGDTGYFESYVAGLGISAEGRKALGAPAAGEAASLVRERDAFFVFEAFRQGHPAARQVLEKIFTMLGVGLGNVVAVLDPDLIVLGGGIAKGAPEFMLETVQKVVRTMHKEMAPPVKLSALEDKAQTYGAIFSALTVAREAIARRL